MLPAAVSRVGGLIQRIGVVGDVAIEAGVNDASVHVEPGPLGDRHALKRGDQPRDLAVVACSDRVHRSAIVKPRSWLGQPHWDVLSVHHLHQPIDDRRQLKAAGRVLARRSADSLHPPSRGALSRAGRERQLRSGHVPFVRGSKDFSGGRTLGY